MSKTTTWSLAIARTPDSQQGDRNLKKRYETDRHMNCEENKLPEPRFGWLAGTISISQESSRCKSEASGMTLHEVGAGPRGLRDGVRPGLRRG